MDLRRLTSTRSGLLVAAAVLLGCARQASEVPRGPGQHDAPGNDGADLHMRLESGRISLNGEAEIPVEVSKLRRIEELSEALEARRSEPGSEGAPSAYRLTAADDVRGVELKSAFQTAAFAGWREALIEAGAGRVALHARIPLPPEQAAQADLPWPEQVLVVIVREAAVELWRASLEGPGEPPKPASSPAERGLGIRGAQEPSSTQVGRVEAQELEARLPRLLEGACRKIPCSPGLVHVDDGSRFSLLRRTLAILAAEVSRTQQELALQFRVSDPGRPGEVPRIRMGPASPARLPPEVIQAKVRQHFGEYRACYEGGLARDPKLTGKVTVRFVVGRNGRVESVAASDDTTLDDAEVVACVVQAFRSLVFPKPEDGIVTVVYPILFAPSTD